MIILPAIDLHQGQCVRLLRGDYATAEKVAADPLETAAGFAAAGAQWMHMVDLDGAKDATPQNLPLILEVAKHTPIQIEVGGGIRSLDTIERYLSGGVARVILGSVAVKQPELVKEAAKAFGERIAVGIDAKNGFVATEGWLETSQVHCKDLALSMCKAGVKTFIFTDIDKDGTLSRPNHALTKALQDALRPLGGLVIASGGIKTLANIKTLKKNGIYGAICGKSLYQGTLSLRDALRVAHRVEGASAIC